MTTPEGIKLWAYFEKHQITIEFLVGFLEGYRENGPTNQGC